MKSIAGSNRQKNFYFVFPHRTNIAPVLINSPNSNELLPCECEKFIDIHSRKCKFWIPHQNKLLNQPNNYVNRIHRCWFYISNKSFKLQMGGYRFIFLFSFLLSISLSWYCFFFHSFANVIDKKTANNRIIQLISVQSIVTHICRIN